MGDGTAFAGFGWEEQRTTVATDVMGHEAMALFVECAFEGHGEARGTQRQAFGTEQFLVVLTVSPGGGGKATGLREV